MKRIISISMPLVLAVWLMEPVLSARIFACTMACCHRRAMLQHAGHSDCSGMEQAANDNGAEVSSQPAPCPGICLLQRRGTEPAPLAHVTTSVFFYSRLLEKSLPIAEGAEPKLLTYAGRAPPLSA
jgi:hypothetical protein